MGLFLIIFISIVITGFVVNSNFGKIKVRSYKRRDGTRVRSHYRKKPRR